MIDHEKYGLSTKSTDLPLHGGPALINDELRYKIITGKVKCKGNLAQLKDSRAIFSDGAVVDGIDVVLFATGYNLDLDFVDDDALRGTIFSRV